MFLTFSQLPNKYIIKSNKTQIYQNPNSQYPTKKKKSSNQRSTQNQRTIKQEPPTPPQQQQENQRSKRVSRSATRSTQGRINLEQADQQFGGTISGLMNGFDEWCDDFWVRDDRWRMGLMIFGFAMIGDE